MCLALFIPHGDGDAYKMVISQSTGMGSEASSVKASGGNFSKHPVLPPISPSPPPPGGKGGNPFVMPPEGEIFTLRERERRRSKEQRASERRLKVHEKSTYSSR